MMIMVTNGKAYLKINDALYEGDCEVHKGIRLPLMRDELLSTECWYSVT